MMQDCHKRQYDVPSVTPDVSKCSKATCPVNSAASPLHMGATAPSRASVVKTLPTKSLKLLEEAVAPLLEAGCTLGLSLSLALTQGLQQAVHAACDAVGVRVSQTSHRSCWQRFLQSSDTMSVVTGPPFQIHETV
jgi:hypothetical protein